MSKNLKIITLICISLGAIKAPMECLAGPRAFYASLSRIMPGTDCFRFQSREPSLANSDRPTLDPELSPNALFAELQSVKRKLEIQEVEHRIDLRRLMGENKAREVALQAKGQNEQTMSGQAYGASQSSMSSSRPVSDPRSLANYFGHSNPMINATAQMLFKNQRDLHNAEQQHLTQQAVRDQVLELLQQVKEAISSKEKCISEAEEAKNYLLLALDRLTSAQSHSRAYMNASSPIVPPITALPDNQDARNALRTANTNLQTQRLELAQMQERFLNIRSELNSTDTQIANLAAIAHGMSAILQTSQEEFFRLVAQTQSRSIQFPEV